MSPFLLAFAVLLTHFCANAAHWAVIVAGSKGYGNYRHQADACHAYQIVRRGGIPQDNIITMAYDDIAHNSENPFPGKIFNKPDPEGPGIDVYDGCKIDYKKRRVNAKTFLNVLTGKGKGKVLRSSAEDDVFVNFVDHGAPGLIAFPSTELHKKQLQNALHEMHNKHMFRHLVLYLESCNSGSMLEGLKVPNVYALSASSPKESSWGTYCPDNGKSADKVNGKHLGTCLGDLFSVNWMEDDDKDWQVETLAQQYNTVKKKTKKSHVMRWGDESFRSEDVEDYVGNKTTHLSTVSLPDESMVVSTHIDMHRIYVSYVRAETSSERLTWADALQKELGKQQAAERVYRMIAEVAYPEDESKQKQVRRAVESPNFPECELAAHAAVREHCTSQFDANSGFALQFHQVIVNICADVARGLNLDVPGVAKLSCSASERRADTLVV